MSAAIFEHVEYVYQCCLNVVNCMRVASQVRNFPALIDRHSFTRVGVQMFIHEHSFLDRILGLGWSTISSFQLPRHPISWCSHAIRLQSNNFDHVQHVETELRPDPAAAKSALSTGSSSITSYFLSPFSDLPTCTPKQLMIRQVSQLFENFVK